MKSLTLLLTASLLWATTATASHWEDHHTGWFRYQWTADDSRVHYCDAIGAINVGGSLYVHDRPGRDLSGTTGTGMVADGGGTFVYQDTNGLDGLQIGGVFDVLWVLGFEVGMVDDQYDIRDDCPNSDTLLGGSQSPTSML